jgi:amidase
MMVGRTSSDNSIIFLPAVEIARLIRDGGVSSLEVVEAHLRQIADHNGRLNAIVTIDEQGARQRARDADLALRRGEVWGPLHGVPFTIKDVFETAGLLTTSGSPRLAKYVPVRDATVVARLRSAGGILLGKTNTPMFAGDNQTHNKVFGQTNNPWDVNRTPGGSSGGSAAAIAAGFSPLDIGSDLGGSVRRPAHYCGVYGLKPSDFVVPHTGHIPPPPNVQSWGLLRYLFSPGPLARSVEDLRLALSLIAGPDGRHSDAIPFQPNSPIIRPPGPLRFAWTDDFDGLPVSEETRQALKDLAVKLEAAGCRVQRAGPSGFDYRQALRTDGEIEQAGFFARSHLPRPILRWIAGSIFSRDPLASGYLSGAGANLGTYASALARRDAFIELLETYLADWDGWLVPTAPTPAFPHTSTRGKLAQLAARIEVDGRPVPYFSGTSAHMNIFNLTGSPVVVLPVARTKEGIPIGVQLVGRRFQDMELLNAAAQIEQVIGPWQAPPGY